jgi:hypothetical protein
MKTSLTALIMMLLANQSYAQDKYFTKTGKILFDATVPASPEKISGVNKSVTCVIDTKTGNMQFSLLMKGFQFERALMEEHFNENYVESTKFPKAEFKGSIVNNSSVNYSKDGTYAVKVKGKLTIHGETKDVESEGKLNIKSGKISALASFLIPFADYKILIPGLVADKLAKTATISVECQLDPLK